MTQRELARQQVAKYRRLAWSAAGDVCGQVDRAVSLAGAALLGCVCWVAGHRWSRWGRSLTPFVPPERRYCPRCGAMEYRGEMSAAEPVLLWRHENIQN